MRDFFFRKVSILFFVLFSAGSIFSLFTAGAVAPLEGSFTTTIVSNDQV